MPLRSWQRDLDSDPGSEIAQMVRRQETPPEPIDLDMYVRTFLGTAAAGGTVYVTQDAALAACDLALSHHIGRSLTKSESVKIGLAFALAWNQRLVRANGGGR